MTLANIQYTVFLLFIIGIVILNLLSFGFRSYHKQ